MKIHKYYIKIALIAGFFLFMQKNSFSQTVVNLYDPVSIKDFNHILDTCSLKEVKVNIFFKNLSFLGDSNKKEKLGRSDKNLEISFKSYSHDLQLENLIVLSNIDIKLDDSIRKKYLYNNRLSGFYKIKHCDFEKNLAISLFKIDFLNDNSNFKDTFFENLESSVSESRNSIFKNYVGTFQQGLALFDNCSFSQIGFGFTSVLIKHAGDLSFKKCLIGKIENSDHDCHQLSGNFKSINIDSCIILSPIRFIGDCESIIITSSGYPQFDFSEFTFPADLIKVQIPIANLTNDPVVTYFHYFKATRRKVEIRKEISPLEINLIIASYRKLLDVYRANGDQVSYNKLYRYSKRAKNLILIQQKDKDLNVWFEFYFNRFLDWYCDYGTNPVKALIYSFYLVLIFAVLFILFPSEPDNLQRHFFIEKIGKYLSYFGSDSHLADLKRKEYEQELAELEDFRLNLEDTIKKAPSIIPWISKPYYQISMIYFNIHLWFLEKVDFARLSWNRMSKNQRIKASLIMTVYMFGFILWGVVVRVMNGMALSMNAFITLGYGEITAKGVARYLAVIEGCMGWFLLSIFSVSLIAQMMQ